MNTKIESSHLQRQAVVYVRQSSMGQVRLRLESQRRQYELADQAKALGFQNVLVIDEDMGRSGTGSVERPGFGKLLTAVCAAEVGAVLSMEASRLARNNRDWYHLIDLCAITHTLVIDHDGVYDPCQLNDRLLLGLKGTMSEFEMSLLRQRALESRKQKILRGKVLNQVAIGYVRTDDDHIEMTPDKQVQDAVHLVFRKFAELGSCRQAYLWFKEERFPLPAWTPRDGHWQVVWRPARYARIFTILRNPVYAGVFVYGRSRTRTEIVDGRTLKRNAEWLPRDKWEVCMPDHHEAYITWDTFIHNQKTIDANAAMRGRMGKSGSGANRNGPALLSGLLRCGHCGRMLSTAYGGQSGHDIFYRCPGEDKVQIKNTCIHFGGARADRVIATEVVEAIQPLGVESSLEAWQRLQEQDGAERKTLQLALEKARFDASRYQRQYDATDPENRLVAAELERRWNEALQREKELERRIADLDANHHAVGAEERSRLMLLGDDLRRVWDHPACPMTLKKRILKTVLEEILVWETADKSQVTMKLHWVGGVHTDLSVKRNKVGQHNRCNSEEVVELIRKLAEGCDDNLIVTTLNRLGYHTGTGKTWTEKRVQHVRHTNGIPAPPPRDQRSWVSCEEAAKLLDVTVPVARRMLKQGILPARQAIAYAPYMINRADLARPEVQREVRFAKEGCRRARLLTKPDDHEMALFKASSEV